MGNSLSEAKNSITHASEAAFLPPPVEILPPEIQNGAPPVEFESPGVKNLPLSSLYSSSDSSFHSERAANTRSWDVFLEEYEAKRSSVYGSAGQTRILTPHARSVIMESVDCVVANAVVEWRIAARALLEVWFEKPGTNDALIRDKHALRHFERDCGDVAIDAVKRLRKLKGPKKTKPTIEPPEIYDATKTAVGARNILDSIGKGGLRRPEGR